MENTTHRAEEQEIEAGNQTAEPCDCGCGKTRENCPGALDIPFDHRHPLGGDGMGEEGRRLDRPMERGSR